MTGCYTCKFQKNPRRLELSISKNTPHGRWGQGPGSVDPRVPAGLPFRVPQILESVAFGDSGKILQQFSRNFPGTFLQNSRKDPRNSHSLLEFSENSNAIGYGYTFTLWRDTGARSVESLRHQDHTSIPSSPHEGV